ncbi:hypothetical protein GIB67_018534 [Kingdonia uniflora]|uniref:Uncharacterized protein n=1 Tax=Kingdonia uniflora TaxID=39325 RepID=A0A7J7LW40_9MAGN|nr:hypothetical protein GIB67_018534 [Kingdonia uniflora]
MANNGRAEATKHTGTRHNLEVVLTDLGSGCQSDIKYYGKGDAPDWTPVKKEHIKTTKNPTQHGHKEQGCSHIQSQVT